MNESEPKAVVEHSVEAAVTPLPLRWIGVGECLPEPGDLVIVSLDGRNRPVRLGFVGDDDLSTWALLAEGEDEYSMEPTHWMKLPLRPFYSSGSVTKRGEADEPESFEPFFREDGTSFIDDLLAAVQRPAEDGARKELIEIARAVEALKRECGMDPESPTAIQNGRYMSISYRIRALADTL